MKEKTLKEILAMRITSSKDLEKMEHDEIIKKAIYSEDENELMIIAKSDYDYAKFQLARNIHASSKVLNILAKCDCRTVRNAAIEHPNALPTTIKIAKMYNERIA